MYEDWGGDGDGAGAGAGRGMGMGMGVGRGGAGYLHQEAHPRDDHRDRQQSCTGAFGR